jgi:hypothetical protein
MALLNFIRVIIRLWSLFNNLIVDNLNRNWHCWGGSVLTKKTNE